MNISDRAAGGAALQHRSYEISDFEFRDDSSDGFTFEGVASVVDTPYTVRDAFGEFTETIRSGAFNKTLRDSKADVALFVNHNTMAMPLATRSSGSLTLSADPHLRVVARLNPERHDVQDLRHAVNDGEMRQMSIGFRVPKARDSWSEDYSERTISEVILSETSVVWRGASPTTTAAMRSLDDILADFDNYDEDELRRIIAACESRIPVTPAEVVDAAVALESERRRQMWELLRHPAA